GVGPGVDRLIPVGREDDLRVGHYGSWASTALSSQITSAFSLTSRWLRTELTANTRWVDSSRIWSSRFTSVPKGRRMLNTRSSRGVVVAGVSTARPSAPVRG